MDTLRIPRPKGLTLLLKNQREETKRIDKKNIRRTLIREYGLNGFSFMGRVMDIKSFADMIGATEVDVMSGLNRGLESMMTPEMIRGTSTAMILRAIFSVAQGTDIATRQVALLQASQGDEYRPYISMALNDSIRGHLQATKLQFEAIKLLTDIGQLEQMVPPQATQFIGTDEAVKIIRANNQVPLLESPQDLKALGAHHGIGTGPNIFAITQDGTEIIQYEEVPKDNKGLYPEVPITLPNNKEAHRLKRQEKRRLDLLMTDESDAFGADTIIEK